MNSRPWPNYAALAPVNTVAQSDSEIQQIYGTINGLIAQFNQLLSLQGGLEKQMRWLLERFKTITGGTVLGTGAPGEYLANGPSWQDLDTAIDALGYQKTPDGGYIEAAIGTAAGQLVTFTDVAAPAVFDPGTIAGAMLWTGEEWAVDTVDLSVISPISAQSLLGNDTDDPAAPAALNATEAKVLLDLDEVTNDAQIAKSIGTANGQLLYFTASATPAALSPGATAGMLKWNGSTAWSVTTVALADMANLAANSIMGNNTGSPATPLALTGAQVKTMLSLSKSDVGLGNVENTALSTWAGTTSITTVGNITTSSGAQWRLPGAAYVNVGESNSGAIKAYINYVSYIEPLAAGGAVTILNYGGGASWLSVNNGITYPARLVLPNA